MQSPSFLHSGAPPEPPVLARELEWELECELELAPPLPPCPVEPGG